MMEPSEPQSLNWKTCFKKILAPHLLNSSYSEGQNYENGQCNNKINLESDCQSSDDTLRDSKISIGIEDDSEIVPNDAELLAMRFKACRLYKNKDCHMAESSRSVPQWKTAFKNLLNRPAEPDNSLETNKEVGRDEFDEPEQKEVEPKTYTKERNMTRYNKRRNLTKSEQHALHMLELARCFKPPKKSNINHFDGAGVNCFKNSNIKVPTDYFTLSKTEKPQNIPPPNGWVTARRFTIEDTFNSPPNIVSEFWDDSGDEW